LKEVEEIAKRRSEKMTISFYSNENSYVILSMWLYHESLLGQSKVLQKLHPWFGLLRFIVNARVLNI